MDKRIILGIYGTGGFARGVKPLADECLARLARLMSQQHEVSPQLLFIETEPVHDSVNGVPVVSERQFLELACDDRYFNIAVADSRARARLAHACLSRGAVPVALQASNATVYEHNDIGPGVILCANTTITVNVRIGSFFHANIYSYVEHDCVIGDFVTFAPGVKCNGNVHIHDHAYIGSGAVIRQGTSREPLVIGEGAVVGMGAVVTRHVDAHTTVVGNPARVLAPRTLE